MSDQDDWDFAGDDDAKMTIEAQFAIYSRAPPAAIGAISCLRSSRSCAKPRRAPTPSTMNCRVADLASG
jgi:hypothetical protein